MPGLRASWPGMTPLVRGNAVMRGAGAGALVHADVPLSFWGGVDPATGEVIDRHHPLSGTRLCGKVLAIPGSRGSCTGSMVLLELLLGGRAPAAVLLRRSDEVIALGAIVAEEMFGLTLPVVALGDDFDEAANAVAACVDGDTVRLFSYMVEGAQGARGAGAAPGEAAEAGLGG
ncbi:unnamed protein product, partial [Prorocentrum cordatum]